MQGLDHGLGLRVLVVDDSAAQRRLLLALLTRWGCLAYEVASAEAALQFLAHDTVDVIISDWMMPGMSGPDFCRCMRQLPDRSYAYFILLTSKSAKSEIAIGLEAGADDFVTKPLSSHELRARLRAGARILAMQAELVEKNRQIEQTLQQLQLHYDALDRDLIEARKLQLTLLQAPFRDYGAAQVALMLQPAGHIGGDLVGCFMLDADLLVIWAVDVCGHGIASAMMTTRLAGFLSGVTPDQNLAFYTAADGSRQRRSPAEVMTAFNRLMLEELQIEQYFTMIYAEIALDSGRLRLTQAGHPHPLVLRGDGRIERLGRGGLPIGLIADASYEDCCVQLEAGDRLFLLSDGITECPDAAGRELGEAGAEALVAGLAGFQTSDLLAELLGKLSLHAGGESFPDDVSALVLEFMGPELLRSTTAGSHWLSVAASKPAPA